MRHLCGFFFYPSSNRAWKPLVWVWNARKAAQWVLSSLKECGFLKSPRRAWFQPNGGDLRSRRSAGIISHQRRRERLGDLLCQTIPSIRSLDKTLSRRSAEDLPNECKSFLLITQQLHHDEALYRGFAIQCFVYNSVLDVTVGVQAMSKYAELWAQNNSNGNRVTTNTFTVNNSSQVTNCNCSSALLLNYLSCHGIDHHPHHLFLPTQQTLV